MKSGNYLTNLLRPLVGVSICIASFLSAIIVRGIIVFMSAGSSPGSGQGWATRYGVAIYLALLVITGILSLITGFKKSWSMLAFLPSLLLLAYFLFRICE
jgi:hypothetical protein